MKKIAIWGWWQGRNLGDNWIKKTMKKIFPYADFIKTSQFDFSEYDFVVCGGGGLFINGVIKPWINYNQEIPFGMIGLGAEFAHRDSEAVQLYNKATFFYVRDEYSLDCMGIENAERSFDITFSYPLEWVEATRVDMNKLLFVWREPGKLLDDEAFNDYIEYKDSYDDWKAIIENNFEDIKIDDFYTTEANIEDIMNERGFVISGRYHGIVAAIQKGIPFIAIDICPKIRALAKECGLEQYCIKISEISKVQDLITEAKNHIHEIRAKEEAYRRQALATLTTQIYEMKYDIFKQIRPIKVLHYGSYWMRENDVVNVMADDLAKITQTKKIDLKAYSKSIDGRIKTKISTKNGSICVLDAEKIIEDINEYSADAIVLNSGGLTLDDEGFEAVEKKGTVKVGLELSDPDVYPYNGKIYADKFDLFYTNSLYSLEKQYSELKDKVFHIPFAASQEHHFYMSDVEKKYDVVVVGHARPDRMEIIKKLSKICKIGTYGKGWEHSLGVVNGIEHVKAINSGKMYLSFSKTVAGYDNVKVGLFEAMACKQVVITSFMPEIEKYFEIGKEILCYKNEQELMEIVEYYVTHPQECEYIRNNAYHRFLKEHTYEKRWIPIIDSIMKKCGENLNAND